MSSHSQSRGFHIDLRRTVPLVLSLVLLGVVGLVAHPPFLVMLLIALALPTALFLGWLAERRARPSFDREFSVLVQRGDADGLQRLLEQSTVVRWFGPPGFIEERSGLVASLQGNWPMADRHLTKAYAQAPSSTKRALLPAMLRAKFESGQLDEAELLGWDLLGQTRFPGTPELILGLILARRADRKDEARRLLGQAAQALGGVDRQRAERTLAELGGPLDPLPYQ